VSIYTEHVPGSKHILPVTAGRSEQQQQGSSLLLISLWLLLCLFSSFFLSDAPLACRRGKAARAAAAVFRGHMPGRPIPGRRPLIPTPIILCRPTLRRQRRPPAATPPAADCRIRCSLYRLIDAQLKER